MAHLAAVLGAIGAPLVLVSSRRYGHPRRARADRARRRRARGVRPGRRLPRPGRARHRRAGGTCRLHGRLRPQAGARPARDPDRGAVPDAARLRREPSFLRRPPGERADRPPAAPLRRRRSSSARAGVEARAGARPGPAAAPTRDRCPARRARLVRCALRALVIRRRCRAEPAAVLPAPVRPPRCGRRPVAVPGLDASRHGDRRGRDSGALRHRGPRRAGHAPGDLLLARRGGGQCVLELLPGDLAVPRPEPLRPSPRARDRDRADGRVVPEDRVPPRCRRDRVPVRRSLLLVLPVEPRRPLRRGRVHRRCGRATGRCGSSRRSPPCSCSRAAGRS